MLFKRSYKVILGGILFFVLKIGNPAHAAPGGLTLNYEAVRFRAVTERQIEVMKNLRDTLRLCESLFPIQVQAEIKKDAGIDSWKIHKQMLSMKTSGEAFNRYLDFLSENGTLREILRKTFPQAPNDKQNPMFRLGTTEFYIRWFWLYPTKDGLQIVAQEDMTQTAMDQIWETGGVRYIFELRFPLPRGLRRSPFWEKGVSKIFKSFPSARVSEDPLELVYEVFPGGASIPAIVQRSLELID
jgi:hypothetical protein